ncbi:MAG: zinc-ribbon domain-containing protein [Proteobacteria bacterium]|nr:zinc-ribbon domain-containing protein [Pseudomonadota bacterium]
MTLATRCPSCGTVFRVVQDQLRVSQGWVRCGRCSEAFNAQEAMVDSPAAPAAEPGERHDTAATVIAAHVPAADEVVIALPPAPASAAPLPVSTPAAPPAPPLIELPPGVEVIASDGAVLVDVAAPPVAAEADAAAEAFDAAERAEARWPTPARGPGAVPTAPSVVHQAAATAPTDIATAIATAIATDIATAAAPDVALAEPLEPPPSFVLRAERAARWRQPGVRLALSATALMAALGLAAQVVYVFRDRIAAGQPAWRPALQQACATLGCRVGDYRQIDALSVESTTLTRAEGAPVYRLAVSLRNRAALEVAAPAIDLSLTDVQGRPIARRVLQMSDLGLPLRALKAGSEVPIQASLSVGDRPVSGYAVEIFYP